MQVAFQQRQWSSIYTQLQMYLPFDSTITVQGIYPMETPLHLAYVHRYSLQPSSHEQKIGSNPISSISDLVGHVFICLLASCISSVEKCVFKSFPHFKLDCFCCWIIRIFYLFWIHDPYHILWFANIFLPFSGLSPISWECPCMQKSFKFWWSSIYQSFAAFAFGVIYKKPLPNQWSWRFVFMFFSESTILLSPKFSFLSHFNFFVWC